MSEISYKGGSIISKKTYVFALDIVTAYKHLVNKKKEYVLSKQLLRAGTSIGANVNEAVSAQSKRDFVHKMSIALKEARETVYWMSLLKDSEYLTPEDYKKLNAAAGEIIKILSSIIITTKEKYFNTKTQTNS